MGVSTVDGSIEKVELKRKRRDIGIYKEIVFREKDGGTRTIKNAVVKDPLNAEMVAGNSGRFYLFTAFDLKGVHGVRKADGTALSAFPGNNAFIFALVAVINIAWIVLRALTDGGVPLLGVGLAILGIVGYVVMRGGLRAAQAQFDGDTHAVAA